MKKLLLPVSIFALFATANSGCKELKRIDMVQVNQFQDSMPRIIPAVTSIHTLQDDDYSKVTIIIGDTRLYADKDNIPQAAVRVGLMVLRVLGPDNSISTGTFAVTGKDSDQDKIPDDAITADMKIDSLKKVLYPVNKDACISNAVQHLQTR